MDKYQELSDRLVTLRSELSGIDQKINEIRADTSITDGSKESTINIALNNRRAVQSKINKTIFDIHVRGRERAFTLAMNMKSGQPASVGAADLKPLNEILEDIVSQADNEVVREINEQKEYLKDIDSKIVRLNSEKQEALKIIRELAAEKFEEAPLFIASEFPLQASELMGTPPIAPSLEVGKTPTNGEMNKMSASEFTFTKADIIRVLQGGPKGHAEMLTALGYPGSEKAGQNKAHIMCKSMPELVNVNHKWMLKSQLNML